MINDAAEQGVKNAQEVKASACSASDREKIMLVKINIGVYMQSYIKKALRLLMHDISIIHQPSLFSVYMLNCLNRCILFFFVFF